MQRRPYAVGLAHAPQSQLHNGVPAGRTLLISASSSSIPSPGPSGTVTCPCSTMYRIHPAYVLWVLEGLIDGQVINQITVPDDIRKDAQVALERMLALR